MPAAERNILIVGGGTTGLMAATLLSQAWPERNIVLVEKSKTLGGLLRSFDYGEHGRFDCGAHNFQETLIPELDDLFLSLLPPEQWHVMGGREREIAGHYYQGTLRENTPFVDLRGLPESLYKDCVQDFFWNLSQQKSDDFDQAPQGAYAFCLRHYGSVITESVIQPILFKLFGKEMQSLHRLPLMFLHLNRVAFLDESLVADLTNSRHLRNRVAFSDQRDLPLERSAGKRNFYPKKLGMQQLIDAFEARLRHRNVTILTEATIREFQQQDGRLTSVTLNRTAQEPLRLSVEHVVWTAGIHPLTLTLGLQDPADCFDPPLQTAFVHFQLNEMLQANDLYYIYPFDSQFLTYRVVNYANFCPQAAQGPSYPVTLELFLRPDTVWDKDALCQRGIEELRGMGLISESAEILFAAAEITTDGLPMPTLKNIELTRTRRDRIQAKALKNLTLLGILAEDELLFHKDVNVHAFQQLKLLIARSLPAVLQESTPCLPIHP
ncbi:NAD(P)-binding protein [Vampirovibrio chlorellavorus]|uniref:NAD(P)-binding protein n=1 Tax=Vampirovibrio chlorellavorus TaxID=758823 RepID=UPI0026E9CA29|nr:NAD(P)-binding protein [Vampirovibrio chlorellavorus]